MLKISNHFSMPPLAHLKKKSAIERSFTVFHATTLNFRFDVTMGPKWLRIAILIQTFAE